jgi:cob(I)alamin adenosyltransferase
MTISAMQYDGRETRKSAALLFGTGKRLLELQQILEPLGCSISDGIALTHSPTQQESAPKFDLLLINLQSDSERPSQELSNISDYLESSNAEAIVWTDMEQLEAAYAILPVSKCHYLVGTSDAEAMLIMARAISRGAMNRVYEGNRDLEFGALNRISDELADFARTLARIADQDDGNAPIGFAEKPVSFRPAPGAVMHPFADLQTGLPQSITSAYVRDTIKLRRLRDKFFDAELFADPAWDILLDLYAARLEAISVSVSSLCIAASVPATTALRWISGMTESGMLVRRHDPKDARRVFIELSSDVAEQMNAYFTEISGKAGRSI